MPPTVETNRTYLKRQIKHRFELPAGARVAMSDVGVRPFRAQRVLDDRLVEWPDRRLTNRRCLLRVRRDGDTTKLAFGGPPQLPAITLREHFLLFDPSASSTS